MIAFHSGSVLSVFQITVLGSSGFTTHGVVMNVMSFNGMSRTCWASSLSLFRLSSPGSTVSDLVAASRKRINRIGFSSVPELFALLISDEMNACCRSMRSMSLPVPMARTRTNASAWSPVTVESPAGRFSPLFGSLTASGRQTSTPPRASTMLLKPLKSTIT